MQLKNSIKINDKLYIHITIISHLNIMQINKINILDTNRNNWLVVNDNVMGGISESNIRFSENKL